MPYFPYPLDNIFPIVSYYHLFLTLDNNAWGESWNWNLEPKWKWRGLGFWFHVNRAFGESFCICAILLEKPLETSLLFYYEIHSRHHSFWLFVDISCSVFGNTLCKDLIRIVVSIFSQSIQFFVWSTNYPVSSCNHSSQCDHLGIVKNPPEVYFLNRLELPTSVCNNSCFL